MTRRHFDPDGIPLDAFGWLLYVLLAAVAVVGGWFVYVAAVVMAP